MQIYAEPEFVRDLSRLNASEKSAIEECLYKLKNRQWDGGLRVKRLKGFPKRVWEARVNRDDRLLFLIDSATHEISGAEGALYVLDVVDHDHVSRVRRRNLAASSWLSLVLEHAKLPRNLVEELIDCTNEQLEGLALDEVRSSGEVTEHLREYAQRFVAPADYIETLSDVDRDIWLTEEQMDVVTTAGHCIVSGTAGSGKTTMAVQRLLADIESPHRKLYLAYNPWLVDYARELFQKLLPTKDKTLLGDSVHFSTVQQIMRDHLGATSGQFSDDAQVRFADFQLPCQSWNRHIAPATAWSEIRSIIKGACLDPGRDLLDLKDYRELGRNRSADLHQDREILHKIAQQYQKWLKEKKHYDEIDLCRQAIRHITSQHPAGYGTIVCDEVQDLTELQLELVFLLHTKPGALFFTGDLNQIINPSGFRWEEVNSHFYRRKQQKPERHHLSYNFRSGGGIVKLADAVLRLRARLAGGGAEQPQDNHLREGQKPRVIDGEETSLKAVLMSMAGRYVVLVRTEAQSKRLKVSLGTPLVHTIDEAKGLEFDQALVWDFFQDHQSLWRKALSGSLSAKDIPAIRHELNLLYVAITRPRRGLFLYDPHLTICLEDELDNVIDYAVPEALAEGSQGGLTAEEWGQQGKYYLDREFFEQAMFCFEQAEDMTSVRRIRARLLEQKKKWAEAAEEYLALQDYAVAARLFEKAGAWAKAAEEYLVLQNYAAAARLFEKARAWRKASRFYHEANSTQDYLRCDAQAAEAENQWADASRIWNSLGQTPRALQAIKKTNDPSLIKPLEAEALASEGKYARAAALYEQLSNWDLAIQNWEKSEHWQEAADVYLKAERYAEADEYALKLSSSLDRAKFRIRILIAQNNLNAARHLAQSEMPLDEAVKFFQQAGLSTEARYFKAYLAEENGQMALALRLWKQIGSEKEIERISLLLSQRISSKTTRMCTNSELLQDASPQKITINKADLVNKNGVTALFQSTLKANHIAVKHFMEIGADVDIQMKSGKTALMAAAFNNDTKCLELLLNAGADTEIKDNDGWSALMYAATYDNKEAVRLLLNYGTDIEVRNGNKKWTNGTTALMSAAYWGNVSVVKLLLEGGADKDAIDYGSRTALQYALAEKRYEIAKMLMAFSANNNKRDQSEKLNLVITQDANDVDFYLESADAHLKCGNLHLAIGDYTNAINLVPLDTEKYADCYFRRGLFHFLSDNLSLAIFDCTQSIKVNHERAGAFLLRGIAYASLGNLEPAIDDLTEAIRVNPNHASAYYNRGLVCTVLGDWQEAINNYLQAIDIDPAFLEAYVNLGCVYRDMGQLDIASNCFDKATLVDPEHNEYQASNRFPPVLIQSRFLS